MLLCNEDIDTRFGIMNGGRVLIADDMGLGKTVSALAIANYFKIQWPLLIICPASLRNTWSEVSLKLIYRL